MKDKDTEFMNRALELAREAAGDGEIPVGAVVVKDGAIIGRGKNRRENGGGAAAHAEIEAITDACKTLGTWRLNGCEIYVTLEPCPMCAGAIVNSRLSRVVFGAADEKAGALGGLFDLTEYPLGSKPEICGQVLCPECKTLLDGFFGARRRDGAERQRACGRLPREFFTRHADTVAPELIGKILCRKNRQTGEITKAAITETECYMGTADSACHAHKGMTERNRVMWSKGGTVYVYLCYGMHNMLNIVTGEKGEPEAVLIRGVEGTYGPGRLTSKFGIDRTLNGSDVCLSDEIWIENNGGLDVPYTCSPRIGIDYADEKDRELLWRFTAEI